MAVFAVARAVRLTVDAMLVDCRKIVHYTCIQSHRQQKDMTPGAGGTKNNLGNEISIFPKNLKSSFLKTAFRKNWLIRPWLTWSR